MFGCKDSDNFLYFHLFQSIIVFVLWLFHIWLFFKTNHDAWQSWPLGFAACYRRDARNDNVISHKRIYFLTRGTVPSVISPLWYEIEILFIIISLQVWIFFTIFASRNLKHLRLWRDYYYPLHLPCLQFSNVMQQTITSIRLRGM